MDIKTFSTESIFFKAIDELNILLSEGIMINHENGTDRIFFFLELIIGDNLGLHTILGFSQSFRANYFCRFCSNHLNEINTILNENQCNLRNSIDHEVQSCNINTSTSGIKESCTFHEIPSYNVIQNACVDVMHDVSEGVCQYDLGLLLHHWIYTEKRFNLIELNTIIQGFQHDKNENNIPGEILENHIKNKRIIISSAEMLYFMNYLSLMIGHLFADDDEYWQLYIVLKLIIEIVTCTALPVDIHDLLKTDIGEYLTLRLQLFSGVNLTPKHHFLVHYPRIMKNVGPLWPVCCIRFEAKHREGKTAAYSYGYKPEKYLSHNSLRQQLKLHYRFMINNTEYRKFSFGPIQKVSLRSLPKIIYDYLEDPPNEINTLKWFKRDC